MAIEVTRNGKLYDTDRKCLVGSVGKGIDPPPEMPRIPRGLRAPENADPKTVTAAYAIYETLDSTGKPDPGMRAAMHLASLSGARGYSIPMRHVQSAAHDLHDEAAEMDWPAPHSREVRAWYRNAHTTIKRLPLGPKRDEALAHLAVAYQSYLNDPGSLTGAEFYSMRHVAGMAEYRANRAIHPDPVRVAIDLDGCLYDFNSVMREWLVSRGWDRDQLPEPDQYSLHDAWGLSGQELGHEMAEALRAGRMFDTGPTFSDARHHMRRIGLAGHHLIVNSARKIPGLEREAYRATMEFLHSNGIYPDPVHNKRTGKTERMHFVAPTDLAGKKDAEFDILIDDYQRNADNAVADGKHAYVLLRKWSDYTGSVPGGSYKAIADRIIDGTWRDLMRSHRRHTESRGAPIPVV